MSESILYAVLNGIAILVIWLALSIVVGFIAGAVIKHGGGDE